MRILILGNSGLLGREISHRLDNTMPVHERVITPNRLDIRDTRNVIRIAHELDVDLILNCAGIGINRKENFDEMMAVNAEAPAQLFQALAKFNEGPRIIQVSSAVERHTSNESESLYATTKTLGTRALYESGLIESNRAKVIRLHNVYGIVRDQRFVWTVIGHAQGGTKIKIRYPNRLRDFCYLGDVGQNLLSVIQDWDLFSNRIEIGTGVRMSLSEAARVIVRATSEEAAKVSFEFADPSDRFNELESSASFTFLACKKRLDEGARLLTARGRE